jgi:hypothetical protein
MTRVYVNRKAHELMAYYVELVELDAATVVLVSAECIGFRLEAGLVRFAD